MSSPSQRAILHQAQEIAPVRECRRNQLKSARQGCPCVLRLRNAGQPVAAQLDLLQFGIEPATLSNRRDLLRLMQYCSLEMGDDIDPLLRKRLGELVENAVRATWSHG